MSNAAPTQSDTLNEAREILDWIVGLRRRIHRHPELGYKEFETSRIVRETLDELGIPYESPVAETGVVGRIGNVDGPCIALRADMDALPMVEQTDIDFKSEVDGAMHACGHDCHTAMLLGAARILKARENELPGTVKLIFQPAEEGGAGAEKMCAQGVLENPKVDRIFGLHVWPVVKTGAIGGRPGAFLAAAGTFSVKVTGVGGHAAMPHLAVDPVICAAKIVVELQTVVSRELDPLEAGVLSVTVIKGGSTHNVIPTDVELQGTIRSLSLEGLKTLQDRIREIAEHVAIANRCTAKIEFPGNDYPPTVNDEALWDLTSDIAVGMLGAENVIEGPPVMGGEDFAYYAQRVPACFIGLGIQNLEAGAIFNVHHPCFLVDEDALPIGSALHVEFAVRSFEKLATTRP
jgi:IAA-amino acid hydrolase